MNKCEIAKEKDIPELTILVNSAYRGESSKKGWTTEADLLDGIRTSEQSLQELMVQEGSVILICRDDSDALIACVNLQEDHSRLYLGMLTVAPELQGGGIGKFLLKEAEAYARSRNAKAIVMTVISVRHELIDWYKRHGYVDTGLKKQFPSGDPRFGLPKQELEFIVMEKSLS